MPERIFERRESDQEILKEMMGDEYGDEFEDFPDARDCDFYEDDYARGEGAEEGLSDDELNHLEKEYEDEDEDRERYNEPEGDFGDLEDTG